MANKTRKYRIMWSWKDEGNRIPTETWHGTATTVPRAISKLVRELNEGVEEDIPIKASEIMVIDVRAEGIA